MKRHKRTFANSGMCFENDCSSIGFVGAQRVNTTVNFVLTGRSGQTLWLCQPISLPRKCFTIKRRDGFGWHCLPVGVSTATLVLQRNTSPQIKSHVSLLFCVYLSNLSLQEAIRLGVVHREELPTSPWLWHGRYARRGLSPELRKQR